MLVQTFLFTERKKAILDNILRLFTENIGLVPVVGAELEFYLFSHGVPITDQEESSRIIKKIFDLCNRGAVDIIESISKERGKGQYELRTKPTFEVGSLAFKLEKTKSIIKSGMARSGITASFASLPQKHDCGNALQINLSLLNKNYYNVFARGGGGEESKELLFAIGGLCQVMQESLFFLLPTTPDYLRCEKNINIALVKKGKCGAPTHVSWGGNNRTTAIRIPDTSNISFGQDLDDHRVLTCQWEKNRRIEHRIPAASADSYLVIAAVLAGVYHGLINQISPLPKVHGNAFDEQYALEKLVGTLQEAEERFLTGRILKQYFC